METNWQRGLIGTKSNNYVNIIYYDSLDVKYFQDNLFHIHLIFFFNIIGTGKGTSKTPIMV